MVDDGALCKVLIPFAGAGALAGAAMAPPAAVMAPPAAVAPPPPPALSSRVIGCSNMLTPEELADASERESLKEDVGEECAQHGEVVSMKVPTSANASCVIYVCFGTAAAASAACAALQGRKCFGLARREAEKDLGAEATATAGSRRCLVWDSRYATFLTDWLVLMPRASRRYL